MTDTMIEYEISFTEKVERDLYNSFTNTAPPLLISLSSYIYIHYL